MKSKKYPDDIFSLIKSALKEELKTNPRPVAVFDADGTLWDTDLGESFFKYQIQNCELANLPPDPWKHYRDWKASGDPRPAYLWLAQINQGQKIETVRKWAADCVQNQMPLPLFEPQKDLINYFQDNGVQIFIVTASIKWSVEPGAKLLGIPAENVLGVASQIHNGTITDTQDGVITYREGKPKALLHATKGQQPFFASGNTMGDFALLESSSRIRLAVSASKPGDELFETEEALRREALQRNWLTYSFPN